MPHSKVSHRIALALGASVFFASMTATIQHPRAGGLDFEDEDHTRGAPFFGLAEEVGTLKRIQGVAVRAQVTGTRTVPILVNTNAEGKFSLLGFGQDVDPNNVQITCSKAGYRSVDVIRRRMPGDADAPVQVECLLAPQ
jgi:hypothetical protein